MSSGASRPSGVPIYQIDAFSETVFAGNPAAICPLDAWLPDARMQAIAAENNLAETAFLVPEGTEDPLAVDVKLRYRGYPQKVANLLLGDDAPILPIVDMTSAAAAIPVD